LRRFFQKAATYLRALGLSLQLRLGETQDHRPGAMEARCKAMPSACARAQQRLPTFFATENSFASGEN
jgi:hypothetical protein